MRVSLRWLGLFLVLFSFESQSSIEVKVRLTPQPSDLIAQLDLEDYVKAVVAAEMPALWPLEALKAQAVAARSYAAAQMKRHQGDDYELTASTKDQVFSLKTLKSIQMDKKKWASVIKAVNATRGMILTDAEGEPYWAYYHADCGGHTEQPKDVWGNQQESGTTDDEGCSLRAPWSVTLDQNALGKDLAVISPVSHGIKAIKVIEKTGSGRVTKLEIRGLEGVITVSGEDLRRLIGFEKLKSALFTVHRRQDTFVFQGTGHGHGVGLCQMGARYWAAQGKTFQEILTHYYPTAQLSHMKPLDGTTSVRRLAKAARLSEEKR